MKRFLSKFWRPIKSIRKYAGVKCVGSLSDVPDQVGNDIYVVGTGAAKWVAFDCPCCKGHTLTVNLMKSMYPRWRLKILKNKVSLSPSIVVTDHPCRSHFWLEGNQVYPAFYD